MLRAFRTGAAGPLGPAMNAWRIFAALRSLEGVVREALGGKSPAPVPFADFAPELAGLLPAREENPWAAAIARLKGR